MRLPHRIVYAPWVSKLTGHHGMTVLFWTFTSRLRISARFVAHEYRHVQHWLAGTAAGAVIVIALHFLFGLSPWFLLASPLGFLVPYLLCLALVGYERNPFERDAERHADGGS